jgi:nitrogen PTS system EIIA component
MPYSRLKLDEAAEYLHVDVYTLEQLVKKREVPFSVIAGQMVFLKNELNKWISQRLLKMEKEHLHKFHHRATELRPKIDHHRTFLSDLITVECIAPELHARTYASLFKELANVAMQTGLLADDKELARLLKEREEIGTTALEKGIAMPHPSIHPPYLFVDSFVIIARLPSGIPFGAQDHHDTDLFFMPCAHDDRQHVYMLARLALMLNNTGLPDELRAADTAGQMLTIFQRYEKEVVDKMAKIYKKADA